MKKMICGILIAVISAIVWIFVAKCYSSNFSAQAAGAIFVSFGTIVYITVNGIAFLIIWRKEI